MESDTARAYVSSFYTSLASSTVMSLLSLSEMREEAATPGGLNEQSLKGLSESEHFQLAEKVSISSIPRNTFMSFEFHFMPPVAVSSLVYFHIYPFNLFVS